MDPNETDNSRAGIRVNSDKFQYCKTHRTLYHKSCTACKDSTIARLEAENASLREGAEKLADMYYKMGLKYNEAVDLMLEQKTRAEQAEKELAEYRKTEKETRK